MQVTEESFDLCGRGSSPLHEWGLPGVDAAVTVPHISPGVYYYICGVAGHCDAGMKIRVVVRQRPTLPPLSTPISATCSGCVFSYSNDATPRLSSVNVSFHKAGGGLIDCSLYSSPLHQCVLYVELCTVCGSLFTALSYCCLCSLGPAQPCCRAYQLAAHRRRISRC